LAPGENAVPAAAAGGGQSAVLSCVREARRFAVDKRFVKTFVLDQEMTL
jgi:hypothetical protein